MRDAERLLTAHYRNNIKTNRSHPPLPLDIYIGSRYKKTYFLPVHGLLGRAETIAAPSLNLNKHRYTVLKRNNVYILVAYSIISLQQAVSLLYQMACCHHFANPTNLVMMRHTVQK